jgi:hypothetical protein
MLPLPIALGDASGGKGGFPNDTLLWRDNGGLGYNTPRPLLRRGNGGGVGLNILPAPTSGMGVALGLKLLRRDKGGLGCSSAAVTLLRQGSGGGDGVGTSGASAPATCEDKCDGLRLRRGLGLLRSQTAALWSTPAIMPRDDKRRSSGEDCVVTLAAENEQAGDKNGGDASDEDEPDGR